MKTEVILKVDTLKNLVAWIARNFVCGEIPSNKRTLYMFANKPGTQEENDATDEYSKFNDENEAEEYFEALSQTKFIIESELSNETVWVHNKGMRNERSSISQIWRITVTPSMNNTEDAFVAYCPRPYNPE